VCWEPKVEEESTKELSELEVEEEEEDGWIGCDDVGR
jgi:hypothetical protein